MAKWCEVGKKWNSRDTWKPTKGHKSDWLMGRLLTNNPDLFSLTGFSFWNNHIEPQGWDKGRDWQRKSKLCVYIFYMQVTYRIQTQHNAFILKSESARVVLAVNSCGWLDAPAALTSFDLIDRSLTRGRELCCAVTGWTVEWRFGPPIRGLWNRICTRKEAVIQYLTWPRPLWWIIHENVSGNC